MTDAAPALAPPGRGGRWRWAICVEAEMAAHPSALFEFDVLAAFYRTRAAEAAR